MKQYSVAVVGATGLVGEMMIKVLEERRFPVARLLPLASSASKGKTVHFNGKDVLVEPLSKDSFKDIDFALFSAGNEISREYAPIAAKAGSIVIDNSAAFRMDKNVPLIVPEVNGGLLCHSEGAKRLKDLPGSTESGGSFDSLGMTNNEGSIIANPNCSTIQLVCVLKPLHDAARVRRVVVSTYQSVSGAGREAIEELEREISNGRSFDSSATGGLAQDDKRGIFPHQIAFNCIPRIDSVEDNGYTKEEMKVVRETRKIMGDDSIQVTCTAVRVPVRVGHSESVNIELEKHLTAKDARQILSATKGIVVIDEPKKDKYPLAIDAEGKDDVFVGRIREDMSRPNCLDLWIVADNLRKGAATNAVQIAEMMI